MSSKRNLRHKQCDGKKRYASHIEAQGAAAAYYRNFGNAWHLSVYKCQFAGGNHWHFGHARFGKTDRNNYKAKQADRMAA
jgi:hypothetical protein